MEFVAKPNAIECVDDAGTILAEVTFPEVEPGVVDINHTQVDASLQGQGIAGKLLEHAVDTIATRGLHARTSCSYAQRWFEKHPEHKGLLA